MNAVAFSILAALIVAGAAATVLAPQVRLGAAALGATVVVVGLLCALTGAVALGIIELLIPLAAGAAIWFGLRRGGYLELLNDRSMPAPGWWYGAGAAAALALLAVVVVALSGSAWHSGTAGAPLLAVLHYWAPYALVIAAAVAVSAAAAAVMLGRTSDDELAAERAAAERRRRDEQLHRRRSEREAAAQRRRAGQAAR